MGQVLVWRAEEKNIFDREQGKSVKDRELVLGNSYRKIADEALINNTRIRRVIIHEPVREVGVRSFSNCTALRELSLKKIHRIKKEAFAGCVHLREVQLPRELDYLGRGAFSRCKRLESLQFPSHTNCSVIPEDSFQECKSLAECRLPEGVQVIRSRAFYKCILLASVKFPDSIRMIGKEAFYQTGISQLELPEGLKVIGDSAFLKCNQLIHVRLPKSVKKIEKWAFHGCNRLKILEIAHDPEFIGDWVINRSAAIRCVKGGKVDEYCQKSGFTAEYL